MKKKTQSERRYKTILEAEKNELEEILKMMEKASELKELEREEEAEGLRKLCLKRLENSTRKTEKEFALMMERACRAEKFDRSILPGEGCVLSENGCVRLCAVKEDDYEDYRELDHETSLNGLKEEPEKYGKALFQSYLRGKAVYYSIFDYKSGAFIGYVAVKNLQEVKWEVAIELLIRYRNKGYGASALMLFLEAFSKLTGEHEYMFRVDPDNYASQGLMRKIGATPEGLDEYLLHGEDLEEFKKSETDLIDENWERVAEIFHVEPVDLLGQVLVYRKIVG